jgi:4-aminobutyrate aminotransferase
MAIGGVIARSDVMDCLEANSISTFGGNPLAMAGAMANLDYLLENDLQTNASKVGRHLKSALEDLGERHEVIGDVRGKGLMIGVELVKPGGKDPNPAAAATILEKAREGGLLIGKGGLYGNCLRIAPPLSLTEAEADEGIAILSKAIAEAG